MLEELSVLHIHQAIGPHEHVIERFLCIAQQLSEELWKEDNNESRLVVNVKGDEGFQVHSLCDTCWRECSDKIY